MKYLKYIDSLVKDYYDFKIYIEFTETVNKPFAIRELNKATDLYVRYGTNYDRWANSEVIFSKKVAKIAVLEKVSA